MRADGQRCSLVGVAISSLKRRDDALKLRKPDNLTFNVLHGLPLVLLFLGLIFATHMGYQVATGEGEAYAKLAIAGFILVYFAYRARFAWQMLFVKEGEEG